METLAFFILGVLAIASALVVVFHRTPVVCALALAFNLATIAGFYMLLNAQFLALLQIIVYAGAIMVLVLFVIMLLNLPSEATLHRSGLFQKILSPVFALAAAGLLSWSLVRGGAQPSAFAPSGEGFGTVASVGTTLFTKYFYPFEAISLLLIVAMIGAVLLAKRKLS